MNNAICKGSTQFRITPQNGSSSDPRILFLHFSLNIQSKYRCLNLKISFERPSLFKIRILLQYPGSKNWQARLYDWVFSAGRSDGHGGEGTDPAATEVGAQLYRRIRISHACVGQQTFSLVSQVQVS